MKLLSILLIPASTFLFTATARAEISELNNPEWQEIPETFVAEVGSSAYININGVVRNGDIITYDVINPDAGYTRLETNCGTNQFRAIRLGYFESATRVNYLNQTEDWGTPTSSFHQTVLNFACNL